MGGSLVLALQLNQHREAWQPQVTSVADGLWCRQGACRCLSMRAGHLLVV
jgi:hypothetical protein